MKRLVLSAMKRCGAFDLARVMSAGMGRILMYHNFSEQIDGDAVNIRELKQQLEYLRRHFHVVPLTSIFDRLRAGLQLHPLTVALTVDDGRRNFYEFLFPLLKEFQLPATFFVVSSFIDGDDWIWTDKVLWLSEQFPRHDDLSSANIGELFARLNRLRPEERNAFIDSTAACMNVLLPTDAPQEYSPCSWAELREMADSGLVEIGSHTRTHPILASITDEESWLELKGSRLQIEEAIGGKVHSFCFPNGKAGDYRPAQLQQASDAGYAGAVVADPGIFDHTANPFVLPRLGVSGRTDALTFRKYLDGVEHYQTKLR